MAIAWDSKISGASSTTYAFNNVAGNLVCVGVENVGSTTEPTGITYAGNAMTKVAFHDYAAQGVTASLWMLMNAPTGSNNVVITGGGGYQASLAASYSGVGTTGQPDNTFDDDNASTGIGLTLALTTVADNCWSVGIFVSTTDVGATVTSGTQRLDDTSNFNGALVDSNGPITPVGVSTLSVADVRNWTGAMASFSPPGGGGAGGPLMSGGSLTHGALLRGGRLTADKMLARDRMLATRIESGLLRAA